MRTALRDVDALLTPAAEFYLDLHRHPELSGQEVRTAGRFAAGLHAAGLDVTSAVGGTGVVGVLRNGSGPVVMLRAELDALPVREATGLSYASVVTDPEPVMHACGHDVHLACLLGTAGLLARHTDRWTGTLLVIGQPAEETLTGAAAMLDDGLYTRWPVPDVVLAQHVAPMPAGLIAHATGTVTAGSVAADLVIHGVGGHSGMPHLAVNPIPVAAAVITELAARPPADVVITVGAIHAGTRSNIIPDRATLTIGLRSGSPAALATATADVERLAGEVAAAAGCPQPPTMTVLSTSPVGVNTPAEAATVRQAHVAHCPAGRVVTCPPSMATEDFPLYGAGGTVPTVYWMIGSIGPKQWASTPGTSAMDKLRAVPPNHSPGFAPDPISTLRTGITAMTVAAWSSLAGPVTPSERYPS